MPPPLTPQDEEEERRRLLESVDYAALDGLAGATSPVTQQAPPASRDDGVIRPFAEPITIGPTQPTQEAPAERVEPAAAPATRPATPAAPAADAWIDPRSSTAPGRRGPWPDAPGSRRVGNTVVYAAGTTPPMAPRAQAVEERLRNGEANDIVAEMDAELASLPPTPPQEAPISPLAPRSSPETDEPEPEPEFHDPDVDERAMAELAGEDMSAQPPVELASLRPRAAALGSPVETTPPDELEEGAVEKPEAAVKEGPQGLIPGEDELASARAGDIPRRLLHNLANAFRAMGGRPANREFVRDEDRVRAQQRQMLGDKRTALGDERRTNEQAMTRALQRRQMDQRDEHQRSQLELASRNADRQDQMSQAQMSRLLEQTQTERADRERAERLTDPASPESARARTVFEGLVSSLPAGDRARVTEALGRSENGQTLAIDNLSAEELNTLQRNMTRYLRNGLRASREDSGGGHGPRPVPAGIAAAGRAQVNPLVERGILSAEAGDALATDLASPDPRIRAEAQRQLAALRPRGGRGGASGESGEELLPGVRAGIPLSPGEARTFRQGFAEMRSQYGALGEIDNVASRYGVSAAIDRNAAGEMTAPLTRLRAMVARLQNTGVINPSEAPAIEAMLPNPASLPQMTFGDLQSRLGSFRGELERAVESELSARGVDDAGVATATRMLRGARAPRAHRGSAPRHGATPAAPPPAAGEARVLMIFPDGRRGRVAESQVQAAIDSRGARRAE